MKKFTIITTAVLAFTMCGCGEKSAGENTAESPYTDKNGNVTAEVVQPCVDYFDGLCNNNADKLISATIPLSYVNCFREKGTYDTIFSEMKDFIIASTIQGLTETYGENPQITYTGEISNTPLSAEQLDWAELCYKTNYYDVETELNLTHGFEVNYSYKIQGAEKSEESQEIACFVKAEDDSWKMLSLTADNLAQYSQLEATQSAE